MRAFAVQVQVEIRHDRREAVGVVNLALGAVPQFEAQPVAARIAIERRDKETLRIGLLHRGGLILENHGCLGGLGKKGADSPNLF